MKQLFTLAFLLVAMQLFAQTNVTGTVYNENKEALPYATIQLNNATTIANEDGQFEFANLSKGTYTLKVVFAGFKPIQKEIEITGNKNQSIEVMFQGGAEIEQVEIFGNPYAHPDKIETITRLPLDTHEQIQSISVISEKLIDQQGNLTISEAVTNVPGVYTFATYGNRSESISSRGFRGIPVLKNGVRVHSDFRGTGILTDMQGVDNIQVLKGSSAITQGVATDLGSPGGVVNIVTKTPKFYQGGEIGFRTNNFGQVRPTFDVFAPLNEKKTIAYRLNGAYDSQNSYRDNVESNALYINPSLQFLLDKNTSIIAELDYYDDSRVPDYGTVNLGSVANNLIYDLPFEEFLGFDSDRSITQNTTYSLRLERTINKKLSLNAAFYGSSLFRDEKFADIYGSPVDTNGDPIYNLRNRYYYITTRDDDNQVAQLDLMGKDLQTGSLTHTLQVGMDYRTSKVATEGSSSDLIDVINVFEPISNTKPQNVEMGSARVSSSQSRSTGVMTQLVTDWNDYIRSFVALRYSTIESTTPETTANNDAWSPVAGIFISPTEHINIFGSYTNSAYSRSAQRLDVDGNPLGNERFDQIEAGLKTSWLEDRLRMNLTLFKINNKNINLPVYDQSTPIWTETGYFQKGGNDQRQGIEFEITGRPLENLHVLAGYALNDAEYKYHTSYVENSAPMNTPKHTANLYGRYSFQETLNGLSIGAGMYYLGDRPVNNWSSGAITHQGIEPGVEPFTNESYTLFNAQINYAVNEQWSAQILGNNILDAEGYNTYRTAFINPINPSTFAARLKYTF